MSSSIFFFSSSKFFGFNKISSLFIQTEDDFKAGGFFKALKGVLFSFFLAELKRLGFVFAGGDIAISIFGFFISFDIFDAGERFNGNKVSLDTSDLHRFFKGTLKRSDSAASVFWIVSLGSSKMSLKLLP